MASHFLPPSVESKPTKPSVKVAAGSQDAQSSIPTVRDSDCGVGGTTSQKRKAAEAAASASTGLPAGVFADDGPIPFYLRGVIIANIVISCVITPWLSKKLAPENRYAAVTFATFFLIM